MLVKLIVDSFDSPVKESIPSFDDENLRLAIVAGKSEPGKFPPISIQLIEMYWSVFRSLSSLSLSSFVDGFPAKVKDVVTPLLSPNGVKIEES